MDPNSSGEDLVFKVIIPPPLSKKEQRNEEKRIKDENYLLLRFKVMYFMHMVDQETIYNYKATRALDRGGAQ